MGSDDSDGIYVEQGEVITHVNTYQPSRPKETRLAGDSRVRAKKNNRRERSEVTTTSTTCCASCIGNYLFVLLYSTGKVRRSVC